MTLSMNIYHNFQSLLRQLMLVAIFVLSITGSAAAQYSSNARTNVHLDNSSDSLLLALQIAEVQEKSILAADQMYILYMYDLRETSDVEILAPKERRRLTKTFASGNSYAVWALGSSLADINLYLYDLYGNLLLYDNLTEVDGLITFDVAHTGEFYLVIQNASPTYNTPVVVLYGYQQ